MNLKSACKTAIVIILLSIFLIMVGYTLSYILSMRSFHLGIIDRVMGNMLKYLLELAGFLIFLLAFAGQLRDQRTNSKALFVIAGILVLLGTLAAAAANLSSARALFDLFGHLKISFYLILYALILISGLCLSSFIFLKASRTAAAKPLVKTILIINLVVCGLIIINSIVYQPWNSHNTIYMIGSAMIIFGYIAKIAAILLFFFVYLKNLPPPQNAVPKPDPVPVPTLSAEQTPPEQ